MFLLSSLPAPIVGLQNLWFEKYDGTAFCHNYLFLSCCMISEWLAVFLKVTETWRSLLGETISLLPKSAWPSSINSQNFPSNLHLAISLKVIAFHIQDVFCKVVILIFSIAFALLLTDSSSGQTVPPLLFLGTPSAQGEYASLTRFHFCHHI